MRRNIRPAIILLVLSAASIAGYAAQSSSGSAATQVRQLAYLKASNSEAGDHFGCGGVLDGHAGYGASISGDGTRVAFISKASNLTKGDRNRRADVFLRDLVAGTTKRVSLDSSGNGGNDDCDSPAISS